MVIFLHYLFLTDETIWPIIKAIINASAIHPTINTQIGTFITVSEFKIIFVIVKPPGNNAATKKQIGEIKTHQNGSESDKTVHRKHKQLHLMQNA